LARAVRRRNVEQIGGSRRRLGAASGGAAFDVARNNKSDVEETAAGTPASCAATAAIGEASRLRRRSATGRDRHDNAHRPARIALRKSRCCRNQQKNAKPEATKSVHGEIVICNKGDSR
jgi:hypothetical protein